MRYYRAFLSIKLDTDTIILVSSISHTQKHKVRQIQRQHTHQRGTRITVRQLTLFKKKSNLYKLITIFLKIAKTLKLCMHETEFQFIYLRNLHPKVN